MKTALARLRRHACFLAALLVTASLYFAWGHGDSMGQSFGDGPSYLMMAQHYSLYGAHDPVYAEAATYIRFPPLYPLVLALLDAAADVQRAHAVTILCLILALLAYYAWLQQQGLAAAQSALLVLAFAAIPGSWLAALSIQSEYLYLFLSLLALTLMDAHRRGGRREALYAAALAVSAAMLTRTIGITLLAPLLILAWRAPRRSGLLAMTLALAPLLAWHTLHRQTLGYLDNLGATYHGGWSSVLGQLAVELPALREGFAANFLLATSWRPLAPALGLLGLAAALWRTGRTRPDGVYVVAHLGILLLWPYPEEAQRFLWVLVPLLLAQPLLCFADFRKEPARTAAPGLWTAVTAGAVLLMSLPALNFAADRYRSAAYSDVPGAGAYVSWYRGDPARAEMVTESEVSIVNAMRAIEEYVPATDCVVSIRPDLVNYFSRRRSEFPPLDSMPEPYFKAAMQMTGCPYAFGMSATDRRFPIALHPLLRLGPEAKTLFVSTIPSEKARSVLVSAALARMSWPQESPAGKAPTAAAPAPGGSTGP